jgi:hypothetical protein
MRELPALFGLGFSTPAKNVSLLFAPDSRELQLLGNPGKGRRFALKPFRYFCTKECVELVAKHQDHDRYSRTEEAFDRDKGDHSEVEARSTQGSSGGPRR